MALRAEFERRRPPTKKQTSTPDGKPAGRRHWAKPPFALMAGRRGSLDAPKKRVRHHWSGSGKDGQNQTTSEPVLPNAPRVRKQCRHSPRASLPTVVSGIPSADRSMGKRGS